MDLSTLKIAARSAEQLKRAESEAEAIAPYQVVGVIIDRGEGGLSPITLQKGSSGGGSVTSIGWPKGLQQALSNAMIEYFEQQVKAARSDLESHGIELD